MNTKRFTLSVFVVLLVLSFAVTTVGAQAEPQVGVANGSDPSQATPPTVDDISTDTIEIQVTHPVPISPTGGKWVFTTTPKFYFTKNPAASAYKIKVYDNRTTTTLFYSFNGPGTCGENYCWLKPTTKLKTFQFPATTGGYYLWTVEAKIGTSWQSPSGAAYFTDISKGFTSTFNANTNKWLTHGPWTRVDPGYLKTKGTLNEIVDARESEFFADGYVYDVVVKQGSQYYIYFDGNDFNYINPGVWANAFYFTGLNNGNWVLWKSYGGTEHYITQGTTPYINNNGWNKFTIWVKGQYAYIYVNEILVTILYDIDLSTAGYVGVGVYKYDTTAKPFLVDYASVYYSNIAPYAIPLTAEGELDPAYIVTPGNTPADRSSTTYK